MFDVIWTDPNRELVGEHRARKDRKKEQKQASKHRPERNSFSTRSSLSSGDSPFSFLKPKGLRQARASKGNTSMESVAAGESTTSSSRSVKSSLPSALDIRKARRTSALSTTGGMSFQDSARPSQDQSVSSRVASSGGELSPGLTSYDSIFSRSPGSDGRTSQSILERASDELSKAAGPSRAQELASLTNQPAEMLSPARKRYSDMESLAVVVSKPQRPLTPPLTPMKGSDPATARRDEWNEPPAPPPKNPLRRSSQRYSSLFKRDGPDTWRSFGEQNNASYGTSQGVARTSIDEEPEAAVPDMPRIEPPDFARLREEVAKMATTSPQETLERMKNIWKTSLLPPKDLIFNAEQHRWMLSVLHHLENAVPSVPCPQDVLVLHDRPDTVAYLASLHPDRQTHHLSEEPLSHETNPSIRPLAVPYVSAAFFPAMAEQFDEAFALRLPSACPSSEIIGTLKKVNRALKPGGALRLTLIDPLPRAATLGRHMRSWLETNLLANLTKRFRCTRPRQLFPDWLGEAALRGPGSTLTTTKFYAMLENVSQGHEKNPDPLLEEMWADRETKAELRSLVGRSLWMLVWGPYVTGDTWWWDDPTCVEECLQLGTVWEYHQIYAVKDDSEPAALLKDTVPEVMI